MRLEKVSLVASLVFLVLFSLVVACRSWLSSVDVAVVSVVSSWQGGFVRWLMGLFSLLGEVVVLFSVTIALLWWCAWRGRAWEAYGLVGLVVGAVVVSAVVKVLVASPRPLAGQGVFAGFGFPSTHVTLAVVFWGWVFLFVARVAPWWRLRVLVGSLGAVLLVAVSRVVLLAHFVSDVVGGVLLGGFLLAVVVVAEHLFLEKGHLVPR